MYKTDKIADNNLLRNMSRNWTFHNHAQYIIALLSKKSLESRDIDEAHGNS